MRYDEPFVGALAIIIAMISVAVALGPWRQPYQLRTIAAIDRRFGKPVARGVWVAIAVTLFATGAAILSGTRPSYAQPTSRTELGQ